MTIGRIDAARLGEITADMGNANHRGAGQGHLGLAVEQSPAGQMDRHQRGGTRGLHVDRRPGQIELKRHARGEEITVVADMAEIAGLAAQFGMVVMQRVARHQPAGSGIDADDALIAQGIVAGVLERLPGDFEKQPLLRIHQPRLARRVAEERRVEPVVLGENGRGLDIVRIADEPRLDPCRKQFFVGETGYRFDATNQILPEHFRGRGAGKPAGNADNGDIAKTGRTHHAASMKSR